mmetsp:Transcript_27602/g.89916  ORF Transcript_27602/g.89916 Transcript_27602/m.89916 type:complete len:236 (-) Transcript_27602:487-1194(-)
MLDINRNIPSEILAANILLELGGGGQEGAVERNLGVGLLFRLLDGIEELGRVLELGSLQGSHLLHRGSPDLLHVLPVKALLLSDLVVHRNGFSQSVGVVHREGRRINVQRGEGIGESSRRNLPVKHLGPGMRHRGPDLCQHLLSVGKPVQLSKLNGFGGQLRMQVAVVDLQVLEALAVHAHVIARTCSMRARQVARVALSFARLLAREGSRVGVCSSLLGAGLARDHVRSLLEDL